MPTVSELQINGRLASAAFPHWFGAILSIYGPGPERNRKIAAMAREALALGWTLGYSDAVAP